MPSALASMTARSCARCRTTSSNAVTLDSATLACPASSSSSSSSTWPTLRPLYRAYRAPYGRPATCDRLSVIVCRPGSAAQIRSSKPPESLVAISTVLPDRISWPDHAALQVGRPAAQLGRQPVQADQPELVLLDQHEAARVGPGELAQAGGDPVEHGLQVQLRVHVGDDIAEPADDPGPLGHVMPDRLVVPVLVADADPAGRPRPALSSIPLASMRRSTMEPSLQVRRVANETWPPLATRSSTALCSARSSSGTNGGSSPTTSAALQPNSRSAAGFQTETRRSGPTRDDRVGGALDHRAGGPVDPVAVTLRHRKLPTHRLMVPLPARPRPVNCANLWGQRVTRSRSRDLRRQPDADRAGIAARLEPATESARPMAMTPLY